MPTLNVKAADETAEIFIVTTDFRLVGRGIHQLTETLEAGIYKVRALFGRGEWQKIVMLRSDAQIDIPRIEFGSAAPLADTNRTHETHMYAAETAEPPEAPAPPPPTGGLMSLRKPSLAPSATLVFMARWFTPDGGGAETLRDPATGAMLATPGGLRLVSLHDAESADSRIIDIDPRRRLGNQVSYFTGDQGGDRFSGASLTAAPGVYTLRLNDGDGILEQTITLIAGYRTHVFALYEPPIHSYRSDEPVTPKRLVDVAIHISRNGLSMGDEAARLSDAARLALADERSTAVNDLLRFVGGKFDSPMLGLYGAHLLHLQKNKEASTAEIERTVQYDDQLFQQVVENLVALFGYDHPDIIALRTGYHPTANDPLQTAPMLWQSWKLLLDATMTSPELIEPSLWRRTSLRSHLRPFFAWHVPHGGGERVMQRGIDLARAVTNAAVEFEALYPSAAGLREGAAPESAREDFIRSCIDQFEAPRAMIERIL
ncbi:MAG: hypothetical protein AAF718_04560 [Pseudomonadota bacterium]